MQLVKIEVFVERVGSSDVAAILLVVVENVGIGSLFY